MTKEAKWELAGTKGMNSKRFKKTFKTQAARETWIDKNWQDIDNLTTRDPDPDSPAEKIKEAYETAYKKAYKTAMQIIYNIEKHRRDFYQTTDAGRINYGQVGDMGHIAAELKETNDFIS